MTMSIGASVSSSSGSMAAALPRTPIDSGRRSSRAATAIATASSSDAACTSRNRCSIRRVIRDWSHSMQMTTPSFIVTASGWAPPMPPSPAVTVIVPASAPPRSSRPPVEPAGIEPVEILSATAANVSNVPCRIPWVPM